jgi:dihydrodipicolinate synthase/N-acetylneuraminate lyase
MSEKRYPQTILATACIPWTEAYEFDEKIFRDQIKDLIKRKIRNIYLFGTAGEGYAVTDEQFENIVKVFAEEMQGPDLYPMVGLISLSFPNMLQRLKKAYEFGIRDFQFTLPSWGVLQDGELNSFVHKLCDPYPDCRFLNYNLLRTKRLLGIREYEKLAEEVPNFVGVKYSNPDIVTILDIINSKCPLQFFLTEIAFGYGSMVGEFGFLISLATSNIERAWEYFNAGVNKDKDKLLEIQQEFFFISKALTKVAGATKIDGAYDKIFCKILNKDFPLRLLPPYESTSEESFAQYCSFLENEYPQWIEKI